jgi:crotonobetainyl-CoA:carnitine CoA-transferase CaiB-like acyl-CoA transferase
MESERPQDTMARIRAIANDLLASAGLPPLTDFTLVGPRPLLDTPLPLADIATAFQLAVVHATAVVAGKAPNSRYEISPAQALAGLEPTHFQRIHQHRFPQSSHGKELKSGFYQTTDGHWYLPSGSYPHLRDGTLAMLDCANTVSAISSAIRARHADELEETAHAKGVPGTWVRKPEEWLNSEAGAAIAASPLLSRQALRAGSPESVNLQTLKVLDLSHVIAGPAVARHFALCGADVLRVSSPSQPDPLPQIMDTGIGKQNAFADFHCAEDLATVQALATEADIIVDSWRPGALAQFGLDAQQLLSRHPRNYIYISVSAYGPVGPWAERKAFDQVVQASTGIAALHADANGKPRLSPTRLLTDYLTGQLGIIGVLGALYQRQQVGGSWHVQVSLARVATYLLALADHSHHGSQSFDALEPDMVTYDGPFGVTHHVAPAVLCSAINHGTIHGPHLLGSSPASWREASPVNDTQTVRSVLSRSD